MPRLSSTIKGLAKSAWWWLRQVMGDAAYDNYLRSAARRQNAGRHVPNSPAANAAREMVYPTPRLLTREEYYLDALRRRYSGVSRCC